MAPKGKKVFTQGSETRDMLRLPTMVVGVVGDLIVPCSICHKAGLPLGSVNARNEKSPAVPEE